MSPDNKQKYNYILVIGIVIPLTTATNSFSNELSSKSQSVTECISEDTDLISPQSIHLSSFLKESLRLDQNSQSETIISQENYFGVELYRKLRSQLANGFISAQKSLPEKELNPRLEFILDEQGQRIGERLILPNYQATRVDWIFELKYGVSSHTFDENGITLKLKMTGQPVDFDHLDLIPHIEHMGQEQLNSTINRVLKKFKNVERQDTALLAMDNANNLLLGLAGVGGTPSIQTINLGPMGNSVSFGSKRVASHKRPKLLLRQSHPVTAEKNHTPPSPDDLRKIRIGSIERLEAIVKENDRPGSLQANLSIYMFLDPRTTPSEFKRINGNAVKISSPLRRESEKFFEMRQRQEGEIFSGIEGLPQILGFIASPTASKEYRAVLNFFRDNPALILAEARLNPTTCCRTSFERFFRRAKGESAAALKSDLDFNILNSTLAPMNFHDIDSALVGLSKLQNSERVRIYLPAPIRGLGHVPWDTISMKIAHFSGETSPSIFVNRFEKHHPLMFEGSVENAREVLRYLNSK